MESEGCIRVACRIESKEEWINRGWKVLKGMNSRMVSIKWMNGWLKVLKGMNSKMESIKVNE